ncbi:cytidine deaminase [Lactobacillus taiwanensis]|uniref:Cytidine deaminase n=2 Tax=Lactobacillus taiwanensis TaxID=508451 RepID=A0A256LCH5_9LACO|nr:cytidine deaminase [Lactobacillus taiwanensis]OYR90117.1 cytidine deaminase [Lactobacillus taiwanensis]OYR91135.1 cytidine deaminase [Lactobacillus taiwanensis]OYR96822.1 cytidine deaminase [Lactobacillus taiwanensis]
MYEEAKSVQGFRQISDHLEAGGVAAAVLSNTGKIYTGVCIDTACTLGVCAERNALFSMITCGENHFKRVLAIMSNGKNGAPCGACREFMVQLMEKDYKNIEVLMDYDRKEITTLGKLTPDWWL